MMKNKLYVTNIYQRLILAIFMLPIGVFCQDKAQSEVFFKGGFSYTTLLDRQASPVMYGGNGYNATLGYYRKKNNHHWQITLNGGKLGFQPSDKNLRYRTKEMTAIVGGLGIACLFEVKEQKKHKLFMGSALKEDILIDFDGIGRWPYIFMSGSIMARAAYEYNFDAKNSVYFDLSVPVISWLTDMPYSQIPRIEGEYPGVASVLKKGTNLAFWGRYQRLDVLVKYQYLFSNHWNIIANYGWSWYHDSKPLDMWTCQGSLTLGFGYKFNSKQKK